ncbi:MAG: CAP domain-containing protein [Clostridium sp.]
MKNSLRTLIVTLGIVVTTGIGSTAYAQDFSALNHADKQGHSIQEMAAKYGIEVPKGLTAEEVLAIKTKVTNRYKATPTKVEAKEANTCKEAPAKEAPVTEAPEKVTPVKETPEKVTPVTETPEKVTPVKEAPAKETPAPTLSEANKLENEVVVLVNQERAKLGLAPLKNNVELSNVARYKSEDMRDKNYFSHTSPTYGSPFDMMKKFGIDYMAAGENIAKGQTTAAEVMKSWMNSPGHKANILSEDFTEIGVGVAKDANGTIYWTQQFIGK